MTSSSSSLSSSGWREKLLQQQSSVGRNGPEDKLTPGQAEHFLSNAGNGMWMGIPDRNPHIALEILQMIQKHPPPKAGLQDVVSALLKQAFGKRPNAEPIILVFYIASCYSFIRFPLTFLVSLSCKYSYSQDRKIIHLGLPC